MNQPVEPPTLTRMWGNQARDLAFDVHCHKCNRCLVEAGGWIACQNSKCDTLLPAENFLYAEPLLEAFKRGGFNQPLLLCSFVGNA